MFLFACSSEDEEEIILKDKNNDIHIQFQKQPTKNKFYNDIRCRI